MPKKTDEDGLPERFDGDLNAARQRLRDLVGAACHLLDAHLLNMASYHLCAYLEVTAKDHGFLQRLMEDMESERQS
jgi:hypothetical protein